VKKKNTVYLTEHPKWKLGTSLGSLVDNVGFGNHTISDAELNFIIKEFPFIVGFLSARGETLASRELTHEYYRFQSYQNARKD